MSSGAVMTMAVFGLVTAGLCLALSYSTGPALGLLSCPTATGAAIGAVLLIAGRPRLVVDAWPALGLLVGGVAANALEWLFDGRVSEFIASLVWPSFKYSDVAMAAARAWLCVQALGAMRHGLHSSRAGGRPGA